MASIAKSVRGDAVFVNAAFVRRCGYYVVAAMLPESQASCGDAGFEGMGQGVSTNS